MSYMGHIGSIDIMTVGDDVYVFVLRRWVRYCPVFEWFNTFAGRIAKRVFWRGRWINIKIDSQVAV